MAEGDAPRVIGEFSDYEGMLAVIRQRVQEFAINGQRFDSFAGLPDGYLSKLIGPSPARRIGMVSMAPLFNALGIYCVVFENKDATMRLQRRLRPRNGSFARRVSLYVNGITDRKWARIQKLGRLARWEKIPKAQRRAIMRAVRAGRKAGAARWKKRAP
jgi:hypothetical protein